MSKEWSPKLPRGCRCVICQEAITAEQSFLASKPRRGKLTAAHTECWEKEQREIKEEKEP